MPAFLNRNQHHQISVSLVLALCCFMHQARLMGAEEALAPSEVDNVAVSQAYALARSALADDIPGVAVKKLSKLHESGQLDDANTLLYVEALIRDGRAHDALDLFESENNLQSGYWKAAALAGCGRFEEAVVEFKAVIDEGEEAPHWEEACLSGASLMLSTQLKEEARVVLERLHSEGAEQFARRASLRLAEILLSEEDYRGALKKLGAEDRAWGAWETPAKILRARCLLGLSEPTGASALLTPLLEQGAKVSLLEYVLIHLGAADALAGEGRKTEAVTVLTSLIENFPDAPFLDRAFDRLAGLSVPEDVVLIDYLKLWSEDEEAGARAKLARFTWAVALKQAGETSEALKKFEEVMQAVGAGKSLSRRTLLEMAEIHALSGAVEKARTFLDTAETGSIFLPELQARISYINGLIEFREGAYDTAARSFSEMSKNPEDAVVAAFNSALAAVRGHDDALFQSALSSLSLRGVEKEVLSQVRIEQALIAASEHHPEAVALLSAVLEEFPDHSRSSEVELALAETYLLSIPAYPRSAQEHLEHAMALGLKSAELKRRADYIRVYIAEASFNDAKVIELATRYLEMWPDTELATRVRMKLAEVYDRNHDFPNAQTHFEILADDLGDNPLAETALFFAGRASMSLFNPAGLDRAVEIFGRVVDLDGSLAPVARLYQAKAKRRSGKGKEALPILDVLIEAETDPSVRKQAIIEKLETLIVIGESGEPDQFEEAEKLAEFMMSEYSDHESQFQTAYLIAKIRERVGDFEGAIAAGYEAMSIGDLEMREISHPNSLGWLYRLGFTTIHLLEETGRNEAAVKIAERLGATRGERAPEARKRAEEIRLRYFIWENS